MRGNKEQKCLEFVKQKIFTDNGIPILHPYTGKSYMEVSDIEFAKDQIYFINSDCHKSYFGLLEKDRNEIEQILRIAKPNNKLSEFPDFVFDNGYIEHFQVSSSKTTHKGAEHIKEMRCFVSRVDKETEVLEGEWSDKPSYDKVRSKSWMLDNPKHSHSLLKTSFKKNWNHHIKSLDKYTGKKDVGIFLIQYSDNALGMSENIYKDWINGMSQGDMIEKKHPHCYRLTRDKVLLEFIYNFKDKVKYVIFVYYNGFEVIRLENIPYLLRLMPWEYQVYPLYVKTVSSLYNISVPINSKNFNEKE